MTDYKQLCAELTDALDNLNCNYNVPNQSALVERARAALAEPQPEPPTDDELLEMFWEYQNGMEELWAGDWPAAARAVLARWGS